MARQQQAPSIYVTHGFDSNPNTFKGVFRAVWCAKHHFTGPWPCDCPPGPQVIAISQSVLPFRISQPVDEVGIGGARGGTKTETLLATAAFRGNPWRAAKLIAAGKKVTGADVCYVAHPNYRALLLREQATDLEDLLDRAERMYRPSGATITRGSPAKAEWPGGAKIIFGHFGEDGWKKYIGPEYQFIGIDQAEMMPTHEIYDRITNSCRSPWPELFPQIMLTFNPGGGDDNRGAPGQAWLMEYFWIEGYEQGKVPKYGIFRNHHGRTIMFIQSKVTDNPYFRYTKPELDAEDASKIICSSCQKSIQVPLPKREKENECPECNGALLAEGQYIKKLQSIASENLRRAWLDGDWHALSGRYFPNFRPNGPLHDEASNANHVYDPATVVVESWWERWISVDYGYIHPTAIYWYAKSPWGQVYVYREVVLNRAGPREIGLLIAEQSRNELEALDYDSHHMNLYLSPDAFARRDSENTIAFQLKEGMRELLGPSAAFLMALTEQEQAMSSADALKSMQERRKSQAATRITIMRADDQRVAGWLHIHELMRWKPIHPVAMPDMEYAARLAEEKGVVFQNEYLRGFTTATEVLPILQISKDCKNLIRGMLDAMHKPGTDDVQKVDASDTKRGDDEIDSLRYGLFSAKQQKLAVAPVEIRVMKRMEELRVMHPGMSPHTQLMAGVAAHYTETHGKKAPPAKFAGHNPLAVRRAMFEARRVN